MTVEDVIAVKAEPVAQGGRHDGRRRSIRGRLPVRVRTGRSWPSAARSPRSPRPRSSATSALDRRCRYAAWSEVRATAVAGYHRPHGPTAPHLADRARSTRCWAGRRPWRRSSWMSRSACRGRGAGRLRFGGEPGGTGSDGTGSGVGAGRCGEILRAYGNLAATGLQAEDAAAAAQETLEGLPSSCRRTCRHDLTVVADAFGTIAEEGVVRGRRR